MNKIMKFALILLFLISFVSIPQASATKHISTHIDGLNKASVHQGESFKEILQVSFYCYLGKFFLGQYGVRCLDDNSVYLNIYDRNKTEVAHYSIKHPHGFGDGLIIHTSNLKPGNYQMTVYFTGKNKKYRTFEPSKTTMELEVLDKLA
jgi:hypothetical protein